MAADSRSRWYSRSSSGWSGTCSAAGTALVKSLTLASSIYCNHSTAFASGYYTIIRAVMNLFIRQFVIDNSAAFSARIERTTNVLQLQSHQTSAYELHQLDASLWPRQTAIDINCPCRHQQFSCRRIASRDNNLFLYFPFRELWR